MINRNSNWAVRQMNSYAEMEHMPPFLLKPAGKDYLWGGQRLNEELMKDIPMEPLAETWECSTHPDGLSNVASGPFWGLTLAEVLKRYPWFVGTHPKGWEQGELPILIKFIDAKENLSVQVHPDDAYAGIHEKGQPGKSEMWYVLDAAENTHLVYGLNRDIDRETLEESIASGTLERYLQRIPVKKGDLFFIRAGIIHAIGAGALIAEIQENSNVTYRLYDYNRVDRNGKKRELHIKKALDVAVLTDQNLPIQPMRVLKYRRGCAVEFLCRCPYFEVYRMLVNTEQCRELVTYRADPASFRVLLCIGGCGSIIPEKGDVLNFFKGDCIFFPADSMMVRLHGKAQFLDVRG